MTRPETQFRPLLRRISHRNDPPLRPYAGQPLRVVAHAGLAARLPGRVPTLATIDQAVASKADMIELDVIMTKDLVPIVFHDVYAPSKRPIRSLTLAEVQAEMPWTLTLDKCMTYVDGRSPVMLDLKLAKGDEDALMELSRWLSRYVKACAARGKSPCVSVCTKDMLQLGYLQRTVPQVDRWVTLPQVDGKRRQIANQVISLLWKHRKEIGWDATRSALKDALQDLPEQHKLRLGKLIKLPWQGIDTEVEELVKSVGATGLTVQHNLVTPEMVAAADEVGVAILAWVVNDVKDIRTARDLGVWGVTTDRVTPTRTALEQMDREAQANGGLAA